MINLMAIVDFFQFWKSSITLCITVWFSETYEKPTVFLKQISSLWHIDGIVVGFFIVESVNPRVSLPSLPSNVWRKIHLGDHWTIGAWPGFKSSRSSIFLPPQMCHQTDNIIANGNKMQTLACRAVLRRRAAALHEADPVTARQNRFE